MTEFERLRSCIRGIPDFPKPGILFRDITPLLADPQARVAAVEAMAGAVEDLAAEIDVVAGIESRGFIFGVPLADRLGASFVPVRKPGKLPADTIAESYELEYGSATLELHRDAVPAGAKVLIVDDLLATGGTAAAAGRLVARLDAKVVSTLFLIEIAGLPGRAQLADQRVDVVLSY